MKFTIDVKEKEIVVPNKIKLIDLLELVTVLDSDTEEFIVRFEDDSKRSCNNYYEFDLEDYLNKIFNIQLNDNR